MIHFLSNQLISLGFPPLHPSIYTKPDAHGDPTMALTSNQLEHLKSTITPILDDFQRRGETVQKLLVRVSEAENSNQELRNSLKSTEFPSIAKEPSIFVVFLRLIC